MPEFCKTITAAWRIGQKLGEVMEADKFAMRGKEDQIMKIRVNMDVTKTLRQSIKVASPDNVVFEIMLKYEKLGIYCSFCGYIRHETRNCEEYLKLSANQQEIKERWNRVLKADQIGWRVEEQKENSHPNPRGKETGFSQPHNKPTPISLLKNLSNLSFNDHNPNRIHNPPNSQIHLNQTNILKPSAQYHISNPQENQNIIPYTRTEPVPGGMEGLIRIEKVGVFHVGSTERGIKRSSKRPKIKHLARNMEVTEVGSKIVGVKRNSEQQDEFLNEEDSISSTEFYSEGLQGAISKAAPQAWQKNLSTNLKKNIAELNSKLNAEKDKGAGADTTMIRVLEVKPEDEYEREKRFWKEKARLQWGDKNTKFFHAKFRMRSSKNKLHRLESDSGEVGTNPEQIASIAQQYFKNLFTTSKPKEPTEELEGLTRRVDNNTNRRLTRPVSDQEIKDAVFSINPLVAPGEDGFTAKFYQFFWDTIKRDVLNAVHSFFEGGKMLRAFNHTHICLIPKDSNISKMN
ncbi:uncharacterized protein LOC107621451 [Arachis ipaensis]|uniref:uncharacterized protein LOC107621451 n=1 Tax=Arachis ipaensis TaxID=130454 RepID=UPI0007AFB7EA|nr:uncharacterized protein LOC107621451 [Arachis ipaensis]